MNSNTNWALSHKIIPYYNPQTQILDSIVSHSLELQKKEISRLKSISIRVLFSSGAYPTPQFKKLTIPRVPFVLDQAYCLISKSVHDVVDSMDYNGIQPFVKLIEHVQTGSPISELNLNAEGEFPSTTCVGMTEALLKTLKNNHDLHGLLVAQRKIGQLGFQHACALLYCLDGFILIDPVSDPSRRIYLLPYQTTTEIEGKSFTTKSPHDLIPIKESSISGEFEYCSHILNAEDMILKHYMAEEPFLSANNPSFPISTYNQDGSASKCIFISIINDTLTLKNMTYAKTDKRRTSEIDIEDVDDDELFCELKKLYDAGQPTFKTPFSQLCKKLKTFVDNIELVKDVFSSVHL